MGLCIGINDGDNIFIGTNSHLFLDVETAINKNNTKIWHIINNNHAIMACQGPIRVSNVIRIIPNLITKYDEQNGGIGYSYILHNVAFRIKNVLKERCYYEDDSNLAFEGIGASFLLGYKNQLYEISSDLAVIQYDDYCCIGSGSSEAIGSLESTIGEEPVERIRKALIAASRTDNTIYYPYIIMNTKNKEVIIIDSENSSGRIIEYDS